MRGAPHAHGYGIHDPREDHARPADPVRAPSRMIHRKIRVQHDLADPCETPEHIRILARNQILAVSPEADKRIAPDHLQLPQRLAAAQDVVFQAQAEVDRAKYQPVAPRLLIRQHADHGRERCEARLGREARKRAGEKFVRIADDAVCIYKNKHVPCRFTRAVVAALRDGLPLRSGVDDDGSPVFTRDLWRVIRTPAV